MLSKITPLILTYNEASNIERSLQQLTWADRIVIVDSYSTDRTLEIVKTYSQTTVFKREFDTHASQWNFGIEQVETDWILSLDADYVLSETLIEELKYLCPSNTIDGYFANFQYCVFNKPLRGTILPPRQLLFRKGHSTYIDDGHTQLLTVKGESANLLGTVLHDDHKPLSRWLWAQDRYMRIEAKKLTTTPQAELCLGDRIRKQVILAPFIVFVYCLLFKGGILDGWRGWYYAFQRMFAETLLSLRLIEIMTLQASTADR